MDNETDWKRLLRSRVNVIMVIVCIVTIEIKRKTSLRSNHMPDVLTTRVIGIYCLIVRKPPENSFYSTPSNTVRRWDIGSPLVQKSFLPFCAVDFLEIKSPYWGSWSSRYGFDTVKRDVIIPNQPAPDAFKLPFVGKGLLVPVRRGLGISMFYNWAIE